jgi:hypothetical protein
MKPLEDTEAVTALREAQLKAGHSVNTRKAYRAWVVRYRAARKLRQCFVPSLGSAPEQPFRLHWI